MLKKVFNIRQAKDRDLPFLPNLDKRAIGLDPYNPPPRHLSGWPRGRLRLDMSDFLQARRNNTLWVAENRHGLAGFALGLPLGGLPLLYEVGVLPEEAGSGLDDALVGAVIRRAAEKGYQRLWTTTFGSLVGENALYGRRGFKPVAYGDGLPDPIALLLKKQLLSGLRDRVALYKEMPSIGRA